MRIWDSFLYLKTMSTNTEKEIKEIIRLFCVTNPGLHSKTEAKYFDEFVITFNGIEDWIILEAIHVCKEKQLYQTKNIMYFKGIVLSKKTEFLKKKELEEKQYTPIPRKIIWGKDE